MLTGNITYHYKIVSIKCNAKHHSGLALKRIQHNAPSLKLEKVILLIRHPLEAALAERTRKKAKGAGGHKSVIQNYTLLMDDQ